MVLVQGGDAEDGHDRVTDELLDRPSVTLEHALHLLEKARHDAAERLRVETLSESRRSRDVGEEHRDGLAHLASRCGRQRGAADPAEAEALGVLLAAARAGEHGQESTMAGTALVVVAAKRAPTTGCHWDGVRLGPVTPSRTRRLARRAHERRHVARRGTLRPHTCHYTPLARRS